QDDDRVIVDAELLECVEDRPEIGVELQQAVGPVALAGFSFELCARVDRKVHQRVIEVEEERFLCVDASLHERLAARDEFKIDVSPHLPRQLPDRPYLLAFAAL